MPPPPPRSLKRRRSIRYIDGNQALATDPFAGAEQSSRSRRRGPKEAPPPSLQASGSPSGHRCRDPPSPSSGRGGGRQPGGEAHNDPEDIRPHALIVLLDLPEGCRWAPRRRPRRDLRLGRDNPSTLVAGEISLPRSSRSQFIRSSLTRGSERCYCRARARTWGGRLRAGPRPLSFVDHGLRTTPLSGTSAPKCPLLDLQQICYLLSSVAVIFQDGGEALVWTCSMFEEIRLTKQGGAYKMMVEHVQILDHDHLFTRHQLTQGIDQNLAFFVVCTMEKTKNRDFKSSQFATLVL
ncbi:uncharacterized protein [Triticum aestivum]|uniref:uncharacterized protein isoform X3 n=1 Tax=Triticum aestivum TaxID=4565 RepID=UPI001D002790|nr:uncharacterized protein LOC123054678 isoform X3 [Triticum aestivum]